MTDKRLKEEEGAKQKLPFLVLALLLLLAFAAEGVFAAILVIAAFGAGYLPVEKILFFVSGVENRRRRGRQMLHKLPETEIDRLLAIVSDGRKIEAIKELRAIDGAGLREAMDAIELLEDFGLKWRSSQDQPPR